MTNAPQIQAIWQQFLVIFSNLIDMETIEIEYPCKEMIPGITFVINLGLESGRERRER